MVDHKQFGKYLKQLRENRHLTTRQVEMYSGVSNSYLSLLERGKRGIPSPEILKKLAPVYKVSYKELMAAAGYLFDVNDLEIADKIKEDGASYLHDMDEKDLVSAIASSTHIDGVPFTDDEKNKLKEISPDIAKIIKALVKQ